MWANNDEDGEDRVWVMTDGSSNSDDANAIDLAHPSRIDANKHSRMPSACDDKAQSKMIPCLYLYWESIAKLLPANINEHSRTTPCEKREHSRMIPCLRESMITAKSEKHSLMAHCLNIEKAALKSKEKALPNGSLLLLRKYRELILRKHSRMTRCLYWESTVKWFHAWL